MGKSGSCRSKAPVVLKCRQRGFWNFVVPAVAGVAGALLNKKSRDKAVDAQQESWAEQNAAQLEVNRQNLEAQKEFAQHGIRWRVADAKAAGLHPLYATGSSGATFSPSFQVAQPRPVAPPQDYSWLAQLGQLMGNALGPDGAAAQQRVAAQQSGGHDSVTINEYPGGGRSVVYPLKGFGLESQVSGRPMMDVTDFEGRPFPGKVSLEKDWIHGSPYAADKFWQRFQFGQGFQVILPKTSEPQEVFEDKPLWFWAMVAKANVNEYGPGWLTQARRQFPSLRDVWDGVVQELESSGILPKVRSAIPDFVRR